MTKTMKKRKDLSPKDGGRTGLECSRCGGIVEVDEKAVEVLCWKCVQRRAGLPKGKGSQNV